MTDEPIRGRLPGRDRDDGAVINLRRHGSKAAVDRYSTGWLDEEL